MGKIDCAIISFLFRHFVKVWYLSWRIGTVVGGRKPPTCSHISQLPSFWRPPHLVSFEAVASQHDRGLHVRNMSKTIAINFSRHMKSKKYFDICSMLMWDLHFQMKKGRVKWETRINSLVSKTDVYTGGALFLHRKKAVFCVFKSFLKFVRCGYRLELHSGMW